MWSKMGGGEMGEQCWKERIVDRRIVDRRIEEG